MNTFEDFHPLIASTIAAIAHEFGRKGSWHGATHEDFSQEMIAWLLDHEESLAVRFCSNTEQATRYVAKCLRNECKDHLDAVKAQSSGGGPETQYDYGRDELKVLLDLMFTQPHDAEAMSVPVIEAVADVERTCAHLSVEDKHILTAFHGDDYSNKMLAELYDISEANMSYRHNRAVLRLQKLLGSTRQEARTGFTGRRAVSNATARAYTSHTYDD